MGVTRRFFQNARRPEGAGGKMMLSMMNVVHNKNALWGLSHIEMSPKAEVLDIGCGGGKNIANLLRISSDSKVYGVDYSPDSVSRSKRTNKAAILQGRAEITHGNVSSLPFGDGRFDVVTAFETIYFWPDLLRDFKEVRRVMKEGATFLICNEASRPEGSEKWTRMIDMTIYTKGDLSKTLREAGFRDISCHEHENGKWLCMTARTC